MTWKEARRAPLTDCQVRHHTVEDWASAHVSALPPAFAPRKKKKHRAPSLLLKTMHILISLIIHPYVTDERILVPVSGAGNMRGRGTQAELEERWEGAAGGGRSSKPQMTLFLQEPETSPCAQRRARWDAHQDSPLWCGEELGKWTFSEYRIIRESSAPRQPSKVWIPQDSRDTLTGSQSLPFH